MPWEQVVWLAPLAIAIVGAYRPRWALFVFAACLPFFGSPPGGPYLAAFDVAAIAVVLVSLRAPRPPRSDLTWPALAMLFVALASLLPLAYGPPSWNPLALLRMATTFSEVESWEALYTWRAAFDVGLGLALFHATRRALGETWRAPFAAAVALGLAATGILGLLEHLQILSLDAYRAIGEHVPVERMHSLFFNSGWLAEYVLVAAPFAVAGLVALHRRLAAVSLTALTLVVVLLSQQRGAWFTCLLLIGVLVVTSRRLLAGSLRLRRWLAAGTAGFALLLAVVLLASPADRSQSLQHRVAQSMSDLAGREVLWAASLELTRQRPVLGWGIGSFAPAYDSIYPPDSPGAYRPRGTAHNWYLNVLTETGVLGLAALALVVAAAAGMLSRARRSEEGSRRTLALGLLLSLLGALIYGIVQHMPFIRANHWLLWMLLAAVASSSERPASLWPRRAAIAIALVTLLVLPLRLLQPAPTWRGERAYGFREPEQSGDRPFQWVGPRAAIRVPWTADCLQIPVANGHPGAAAGAHPVEVTVRAAEASRRLHPVGRWDEAVLEVGPPRAESLLVELTTRPTFRPFRDFPDMGLPPSPDVRSLGAAIGTIESLPCAALGRARPERRPS